MSLRLFELDKDQEAKKYKWIHSILLGDDLKTSTFSK